MRSDSETLPQVSSYATTPLLLSPTISRDVGSQRISAAPRFDAGSELPAVGSGRRIIEAQTQNSHESNFVLEPTRNALDRQFESRKSFSEHRNFTPDTFYTFDDQTETQQNQYNYSPSHQTQTIEDHNCDTLIKQSIPHIAFTSGTSIRGPNSGTIRGKQQKQEDHLCFPSTQDTSSIGRQRPVDPQHLQQQHQQQHVLAVLPQHPQPPVQYIATAAEIAHPSYSQNHKTGDSQRGLPMVSYGDARRGSKRNAIPFQGKETDENGSRTSHSTDSITAMSPGRMTPIHDTLGDQVIVGTPSTVSTAPSSDDEAIPDYKLDESNLPRLLYPIHRRRRSFGEDDTLHSNNSIESHLDSRQSTQNPWLHQTPPRTRYTRPPLLPTPHISQQHQPEHRIASFRRDGNINQQTKQNENVVQVRNQRLQSPPRQPFLYSQHMSQQQIPQGNRKIQPAHQSSPKPSTPPRSGRSVRQQSGRQAPVGGAAGSPHQLGFTSSQRSSSEVLKTLLRKKACLYEPDTSRSVALVTWLVGRVLGLEYGFFSRQQLQSGVHACVASKIEAGVITRTKVNRCMQIILNSCFHYIIPRSDGTEEKGDYFRASFTKTVQDDCILLKDLPKPWNDLIVDRATVVNAILHDTEEKLSSSRSPSTSPKHSPKIVGHNADRSSDKYIFDGEKEETSKRGVLLCFNENVRSAEDVFRCHNDFIRDTANASSLQLTAHEWSQFFDQEGSLDPHRFENVAQIGGFLGGTPIQTDLFGRMSSDSVAKFRTTWCTKRYEHDHDLCGFAHIEINGGWLRRNPLIHSYENDMCRFVTHVENDMVPVGSPRNFFLNECPHGIACDLAHSLEEINYHPKTYKNRVCNLYTKSGGCGLGDVCPHAHPPESNRPFKNPPDVRSPDKRGKGNFEQGKLNGIPLPDTTISVSPIVYASPAPISRFELQLGMPGLKNLYRRQSEVVRAYVRSFGKCQCSYSLFGDNPATESTANEATS